MTSRTWRWGSGLILPFLAAAMDAAWIAPYSLLLGSIWRFPGRRLLPPEVVFGLLATSQLLTRRLLAGMRA